MHRRYEFRRRAATMLIAATLSLVAAGRLARAQDVGAATKASIVGTVRDDAGVPLAGAQVSAAGVNASTDSLGAFALRGLPVGLVTLTVRHLGFRPIVAQWNLAAEGLTLDLRMIALPRALPAVLVRSRREPYDSRLAGFNRRRAEKLGYYITRQDIVKGNTFVMTDALQRLPGVKVVTMPGALGRTVRLAGQACPPLVFVDGFPASLGRFDLDMVDLESVEGVEVYPNASSIPADFMGPYGMENCGVIAIWSRPMRPTVRSDQLPPEHVDLDSLLASHTVYLPDAVDVQAAYVAHSADPLYPDSLYLTRTPGRVVVRLVVSVNGDVEPGTPEIVSATQPAFADAVRAVIGRARFTPAQVGGRAVRAMVELPFDFNVAADTVAKRR